MRTVNSRRRTRLRGVSPVRLQINNQSRNRFRRLTKRANWRHRVKYRANKLRRWRGWTRTPTAIGTLVLICGLYYTARSLQATQVQARSTESQVHLAEQGQLTDRFGKAIEQLSSDKLDVRLGGIYALEYLIHDAPSYQPTAVGVLSAFVQNHAPNDSRCSTQQRKPPNDIQVAMTIIGRRDLRHDGPDRIDFSGSCLIGVKLRDATLARAIFSNSDLSYAELVGANLDDARLTGTRLTRASMSWANLNEAWLDDADLTEADLTRAKLTHALLSGANLTNSHLNYPQGGGKTAPADMTGAIATEANLTGAILSEMSLSGAYLRDSDLTRAELAGSDLTHADLSGTLLLGAVVYGAKLSGVNLSKANLAESDLRDVDLTSADLRGAKLRGAQHDSQTRVENSIRDNQTEGCWW